MLKQLILENWKSFRHAVLDIDPLTVLIGTNASGKSNALEALEFLKRTAEGKQLESALVGDQTLPAIRGGSDWSSLRGETQFTLKVLVQGENDNTDYLYSLTVETKPQVRLFAESLTQLEKNQSNRKNIKKIPLFHADLSLKNFLSVQLYQEQYSDNVEFARIYSILSLLVFSIPLDDEINKGIETVLNTLKNIAIFNPISSQMRNYSRLSNSIQSDASNIAGVLAALPDQQKKEVESTILTYVKHLPERDIQKVWAETVGRLNSDAMLYCEEQWIPDQPPMLIDARGMSDGTLRFLGIIVALMTRPEGSQLIIEDVDNGLHPSRSELLVKMLREIGEQRKIDILVTTHNPSLLDALGPEIVPFVVVAHRDKETGESKLTLVEDIQNFPKLFASASLGKLTENGAIERSLVRSS